MKGRFPQFRNDAQFNVKVISAKIEIKLWWKCQNKMTFVVSREILKSRTSCKTTERHCKENKIKHWKAERTWWSKSAVNDSDFEKTFSDICVNGFARVEIRDASCSLAPGRMRQSSHCLTYAHCIFRGSNADKVTMPQSKITLDRGHNLTHFVNAPHVLPPFPCRDKFISWHIPSSADNVRDAKLHETSTISAPSWPRL